MFISFINVFCSSISCLLFVKETIVLREEKINKEVGQKSEIPQHKQNTREQKTKKTPSMNSWEGLKDSRG